MNEQDPTRVRSRRRQPRTDAMHGNRTSVRGRSCTVGPASHRVFGDAGRCRTDDARTQRTKVSGENGERKNRSTCCTPVRTSLLSPPDPQHRRRRGCVELGERLDVGRIQATDPGRVGDRRIGGRRQVLVGAIGMFGEERAIDVALPGPVVRDGQRQHHIGSRSHGKVQVGALGHGGASRIDHDDLRPVLHGLLHKWWEVRVGDRGVGSPNHDDFRVDHIEGVGGYEAGDDTIPAGASCRPTDRVDGLGRTDLFEQRFGEAVCLMYAGRGVVRERNNRITAAFGEARLHLCTYDRDSFVPCRRTEFAGALLADANERGEHAIGPVNPLRMALHLLADPPVGQRVSRSRVDVGNDAVGHGDRKRTRIRTVEGARGRKNAGAGNGRHDGSLAKFDTG